MNPGERLNVTTLSFLPRGVVLNYCFVLLPQLRTNLDRSVVSSASFWSSCLVWAQCLGLSSLHFPDGINREFGIKNLCSCPWSSYHSHKRVPVLILGWITSPKPLIYLLDSLSWPTKYSAMCEMHRVHLLSIPMVAEYISIWNTLSFRGVEVLVGIDITGKKLIGGIVIDGFVIIKSLNQAAIFNFLVLNLSLPLLAYTSYFPLFF